MMQGLMTLLLIDDTSAIVLISSDIVQLTEIQQVYLIIETIALKVKSYIVLQDQLSYKCDLR